MKEKFDLRASGLGLGIRVGFCAAQLTRNRACQASRRHSNTEAAIRRARLQSQNAA